MPRHPLYESPIKGTSVPTKTPAPPASPANAEPRGKTRFGPDVRTERATVKNRFNVDPRGTRKAMTPPSRVR